MPFTYHLNLMRIYALPVLRATVALRYAPLRATTHATLSLCGTVTLRCIPPASASFGLLLLCRRTPVDLFAVPRTASCAHRARADGNTYTFFSLYRTFTTSALPHARLRLPFLLLLMPFLCLVHFVVPGSPL